jgi:hypothetical protein
LFDHYIFETGGKVGKRGKTVGAAVDQAGRNRALT